MTTISEYQQQIVVADVFDRCGGENIELTISPLQTCFVKCKRGNDSYMFSFSKNNPNTSYILTINDIYRFVTFSFGEIMLEFEKCVYDKDYVIKRNKYADLMSEKTGLP